MSRHRAVLAEPGPKRVPQGNQGLKLLTGRHRGAQLHPAPFHPAPFRRGGQVVHRTAAGGLWSLARSRARCRVLHRILERILPDRAVREKRPGWEPGPAQVQALRQAGVRRRHFPTLQAPACRTPATAEAAGRRRQPPSYVYCLPGWSSSAPHSLFHYVPYINVRSAQCGAECGAGVSSAAAQSQNGCAVGRAGGGAVAGNAGAPGASQAPGAFEEVEGGAG